MTALGDGKPIRREGAGGHTWSGVYRESADGTWVPLDALPISRRVRAEAWLRAHRLGWLARLSVWADERGLG